MTRLSHSGRSSSALTALVLGGALGAAALLQSGTAEAGVHVSGRVHVGGSVRVRAGGGGNFAVRVGRPYARPWHRHRWFGGSVWVGGYYYPRPYYYYYPEYVPSYYGYAP